MRRVALLFVLAIAQPEVVAQSLTLTLTLAKTTLDQFEPLEACLKLANQTANPIIGKLSDLVPLEEQQADGTWEAASPWPHGGGWTLDTNSLPTVRRRMRTLDAQAAVWHVWHPLLSPVTSRPGVYRLGPYRFIDDSGAEVASNVITFTVVPHVNNNAVLSAQVAKYEALISQSLQMPDPAKTAAQVQFAEQLLADSQLSNGVRAYAALRISEYRFSVSRDYSASSTAALLLQSVGGSLPCGGTVAIAKYLKIRADWLLAANQVQFDQASAAYDAFKLQYPEYEKAYSPRRYEGRRELLPAN